ncbi:MAG: hypothetical protein JNJ85_00035 [Candidatus Kapabacteria bacterium]|nr:hypothetical protein [Candidatus Kapabacteria bacterium]
MSILYQQYCFDSDYQLRLNQTNTVHVNPRDYELRPPTGHFYFVDEVILSIYKEYNVILKEWSAYIQSLYEDVKNNRFSSEEQECIVNLLKNLISISKLIEENKVIDKIAECSYVDYIPELSIDEAGLHSFEWYGRRGAKANMTVSQNGIIYFVSTFHNTSSVKYRFSVKSNFPNEVKNEIRRIYEDAIDYQ